MEEIIDIIRKKDFTFLLGAGASKEAGIPLTTELPKCIHEKLENNVNLQHMFSVIIDGIKFGKTQKGSSPFEDINIEEAISAIRLISERHHLEIAPFIYSWNPLIDELDQRIDKFKQLKDQLDLVNKDLKNFKDIAERNFNQIERHLRSDKSRSATLQKTSPTFNRFRFHSNIAEGRFKDLLNKIQSTLIEIMYIDDIKKIKYIDCLTKYANENLIEVFTLNYDDTIELSCFQNIVNLQEGFAKNEYIHSWPDSKKGINLFKLHGSISWQQDNEGNITKYIPQMASQSLPLLIIGNRDKLNQDGPFLDLLFEFSNRLDKYLHLFVTGYSFGDMHINRVVNKWLKGNRKRKIIIANGPSFELKEITHNSQYSNSLLKTSELYEFLKHTHSEE